ncbi:MAG: hypothetical protein ACYCW6_03535 [Candidatus Xenobia bacterium]
MKQALDGQANGKVFVVTMDACETRHQEESSENVSFYYSNLIISESYGMSREVDQSSSTSRRVFYSVTPLTTWSDLEMIPQGDRIGVPGASTLPASGSEVTQCLSYEQSHFKASIDSMSVFGGWAAESKNGHREEGCVQQNLEIFQQVVGPRTTVSRPASLDAGRS